MPLRLEAQLPVNNRPVPHQSGSRDGCLDFEDLSLHVFSFGSSIRQLLRAYKRKVYFTQQV